MKTFAKILIACTLLLAVTMSFASCGLFGLNLEKLEDKLEDKGYEAEFYTDSELTSFIKSSIFASLVDSDKVESLLVAGSENGKETFVAIELESKEDAEKVYESIESYIDTIKNYSQVELEYGMKGAVVYIGTSGIIDDAI